MDRNINRNVADSQSQKSLSARRAWIEICLKPLIALFDFVALRKESVDRNVDLDADSLTDDVVALRKESVDRNFVALKGQVKPCVALRKESVDRNAIMPLRSRLKRASLSARRAWIEMLRPPACSLPAECRSPQGEHGMFLFLTVQGGFVHADIRFNFKNCYSKKLSHKII